MQREVFGQLDFVAALWRRDYKTIAENAQLSGIPTDDKAKLAEIVEERTKAVGVAERTGMALKVDRAVSRVMAVVLPVRFQV